MRVRSIAIAYLIGIAVLAVAAASVISYFQWGHLSDLDQARRLTSAIGSANRFTEAVSLERGVYTHLIISDRTPEQRLQLVDERKAATDAVLSELIAEIDAFPGDQSILLRGPVLGAREMILAARSKGDRIWRAPENSRAAGALDAVFADLAAANDHLDRATIRLERALSDKDPRLGIMIGVGRLANEMRDAAGRRSVLLSRYVATSEQQDPLAVASVSELTGQVKAAWRRLQRTVRQIGPSPKVETAVQHMRATFMDEGETGYARMAQAARDGTALPMERTAWRDWNAGMMAHIRAVRDAPIAQALDDLVELRATASFYLLLMLCGAVGVVLTVVGTGLFLEWRILRPIAVLTKAIDHDAEEGSGRKASAGVYAAIRYEARSDEIGSLARAVERLQQRNIQIQRLSERFDTALANLPQGLCVFDAEERLVVANDRYPEIYGITADNVRPGTTLSEILQHRINAGSCPTDIDQYVLDCHASTPKGGGEDHRVVQLQDGRAIAVRTQSLPGGGWLATHEDITLRLAAEAKIAHMAHHDGLTQLPNRTLFRDEMNRAAQRVGRGEEFAVLCLDLDQFKRVNDTLGHPVGDGLLRQVAERLKTCVRETDTVARLGGDEFAIVQTLAKQPEGASVLARRLIDSISAPYDVGGHHIVIGTSVGISIAPHDGSEPDQLLKNADMALYRAKGEGRGTFRFFEHDMDAKIQARRLLEIDLRQALVEQEFELHYQPIMNLASGRISGFEALLRWNHPVRGRVPPDQFIPLAEEVGLIVPIGRWVLQEACREAMTWSDDLSVAVNISPMQFRNRRLALDVIACLGESGLPGRRLELEITETTLLLDTEATLSTLHELRELGIRISMDDFGTGYSSLNYLRKFPFDKIKIDQSFVQGLAEHSDSSAIVRAVTGLGTSLGICTTAEGVETREQLAKLLEEHCTEVQGYLISAPRPARDIPLMLERADNLMKRAS